MVNFFIRRPIVEIVVAIVTVVVGAITIALLPIAQFPNIAPPEIWLQANYPGADAKTLEQSVATPIEQQVTGVDNMEYMYSVNTTNGSQTSLLVILISRLIPTRISYLRNRDSNSRPVTFRPRKRAMGLGCESRLPLLSCWSASTRPTAAAMLRFSLTMRTSTSTTPSAAPMEPD